MPEQDKCLFGDLPALAELWLRVTSHDEEAFWLRPDLAAAPWHKKRSERETDNQYSDRLRRLWLLYEMGSPERRCFGEACRRAIKLYRQLRPWLEQPSAPLEAVRSALETAKVHNAHRFIAVLRAYLLCAREAGDSKFWPAGGEIASTVCDAIGRETGLPRGWVADLAADLLVRPLRRTVGWRSVTTLLKSTKTGEGETFELVLETVPSVAAENEARFYPSPQFSLVTLDETFEKAAASAWKLVTQTYRLAPGNHDVRWSLRPRRHRLPHEIRGPSASGAQALALAHLLAAMPEGH